VYNPPPFQVTDRIVLRDTIRRLGAGELITAGAAGLEATLVPVLVDDDATRLTAHVARANPQWRNDGADALVTFRGPDAYVSPGWYPSKREHGKVVPTWNYVVVQARGRLIVHDDPAWVLDLVRRLTDVHEAGRAEPWSVDDAPADYLEGMARAIVGVEVEITDLVGKWKLSQNRPVADAAGVIEGLRLGGSPSQLAVAEAMERGAG
jgi:transcriptional regulator